MKTLKDLQEMWNDDLEEKLLGEFHKLNPSCEYNHKERPLFVKRQIFKDGQEQYIGKCMACKKIHFSTHQYNFSKKCPSCDIPIHSVDFGSNNCYTYYNNFEYFHLGTSYTVSETNDDAFSFVYKVDEESFIIVIIGREWCQEGNEEDVYVKDGENAWLDKPFYSVDKIRDAFFFTKKFGCRAFYKNKNEVARNTSANTHHIESNIPLTAFPIENKDETELVKIITDATGKSFKTLRYCLLGYNSYLNEIKPKKAKKEEVSFDELIPDIDKNSIYNNIMDSYDSELPGGIVDISGTTATYSLLCFCENIIKAKQENIVPNSYLSFEVDTVCPCCGRVIKQTVSTNDRKNSKIIRGSKWERIDENNIILRFFEIFYSINLQTNEYTVSDITETEIYLFTPKKMFYLSRNKDSWVKGTLTAIPQYSYSYGRSKSYCFNSKEELEEIINSSFLKTTGLMQAWGLGDFQNYEIENPFSKFSRCSYLYQWYKKPYLELVVKANLKEITKELMHSDVDNNYLATNIYDMFNITKSVLRITRLRDLSLGDMKLLKKCYDLQSNFSIEQWDEIVSGGFNIKHFLDTCETTESSIKRLLEYLQSCYDNQCIPKTNALTIYADYYNMAKKIGFNLSDNAIKYPNSLKKEHDKAIFAYKVVENEIKKKAFTENSILNKKYEYSKGNLTVVIPMTPDEVIREGQLQKHCVASYVNRIESGSTCICFIRKKDDIDTPYFTCEIYDGKLYQVKGYCNKYPNKKDDSELIEFLESWAKKYDLDIEYMKH